MTKRVVEYISFHDILLIAAYRTDEGKPWVLPIVKKVQKNLADDETLNKEYLPVLGLEAFSNAATKMLLGENSTPLAEGRVGYFIAEIIKKHILK